MLDAARPSSSTSSRRPRRIAASSPRRRGWLPAICQKPFAPTYAEAVALVEPAERPACLFVVHENIRWAPWHREAKRLIDAGALGTLHSVAFRLRPGDGQGPRAYLDRQPYFQQMPRLLVYETAIHWIDTFRFLMGEVTAVYARAAADEPGDRRRGRRLHRVRVRRAARPACSTATA